MICGRCRRPSHRLTYKSENGHPIKLCDECLSPKVEPLELESSGGFDFIKAIENINREMIIKHLGLRKKDIQ